MSDDEFTCPDTPAEAVELEYQGKFDQLASTRQRMQVLTLTLLHNEVVPREQVLNILAVAVQAVELLLLHFTEEGLEQYLREDQRNLVEEIFSEEEEKE